MVATSASACAARRSGSASSPGWPRNRFNAPMTRSRCRIGTACTDRNPSPRASVANSGHRSGLGGDVRDRLRRPGAVAVETRSAAGADLQHLQQFDAFTGGGQHVQLAVTVGQHQPGGGRVQQVDAHLDQVLHQFDHVVAGDQGVRQRHQRVDEPGFPGRAAHGFNGSGIARGRHRSSPASCNRRPAPGVVHRRCGDPGGGGLTGLCAARPRPGARPRTPQDKGETLERSERVLDVAFLSQTPCRGSVLLIRVLLVGLGQRGAVADGRRCVGADFVSSGLS